MGSQNHSVHRVTDVCFLKTVSSVKATEVTVYDGDNVTLTSGADPSWRLSKVEWSILTNYTLIATYRKGRLNVEWFYQYRGRLSLNTSTGKRPTRLPKALTVNELLFFFPDNPFFHMYVR